jgi:hypothetical protein
MERDNSEDKGIDRRMRSIWILGRLTGAVWSGLNWLRIGGGRVLVVGCCECGDEPSGHYITDLVIYLVLNTRGSNTAAKRYLWVIQGFKSSSFLLINKKSESVSVCLCVCMYFV